MDSHREEFKLKSNAARNSNSGSRKAKVRELLWVCNIRRQNENFFPANEYGFRQAAGSSECRPELAYRWVPLG